MTAPIIADVRRAAAGVRVAVEQALAGYAPLSKCRQCEEEFFFLTPTGLEPTASELCPRCETEGGSEQGLGLEVAALWRMVDDRRGLLAVARTVAASRKTTLADAVLYMERLEANETAFMGMLGLAKKAAWRSPEAAWRAAFLCWTEGLAAAAVHDPVAAQMARLAATARPEAVERVVVRARGRKLYDGPVTPEAGRIIREGEDKHGRKLLVTLHHNDGTKTLRRGERETAEEHRFDDAKLGGVRAMMMIHPSNVERLLE